ncbi:MAG: hypothetical protein AAFV88_13300 [Planctomycetota bacterium]
MNLSDLLTRLDSIGWEPALTPESMERLCEIPLRGDSHELAVIAGELAIECQPITLRGLFYRVVSAGFFPSTDKKHYGKLQRLMSTLREYRWIPYEWIVDNLRSTIKPSSWSGLEDFTETVRNSYRKNFWASLPNYVHVFVEKDAMAGVIDPVTHELDVSLSPVRGYTSDSYAHAIGQSFRSIDKPIKCFYLGDFDPSGFDLERSLREKIEFHAEKPIGGDEVTWERLALNQQDFDEFGLHELEVKLTDTRARSFIKEHGERCAEVDALDPKVIRERVRNAIMQYVPSDEWERLKDVERIEREAWESTLGQFSGGTAE